LSAPRLQRWSLGPSAAREAFAALRERVGTASITATALSREYDQRLRADTPRVGLDVAETVTGQSSGPVLALLVDLDRSLHTLTGASTDQAGLSRSIAEYAARVVTGPWRGQATDLARFEGGRYTSLAGFVHVCAVLAGQGEAARARLDAHCPNWRQAQREELEHPDRLAYTEGSVELRARFGAWCEAIGAELGDRPRLSPSTAIRLMRATFHANLADGIPRQVMAAVVGAGVRLDTPLEGKGACVGETVQSLVESGQPGSMRGLWRELLLRARLQCTHRIEQPMPTL